MEGDSKLLLVAVRPHFNVHPQLTQGDEAEEGTLVSAVGLN